MNLGLFFYLLAAIAFGLVMLEKEVIGLEGLPLTGGGLFCLVLGLLLSGISLPTININRPGQS